MNSSGFCHLHNHTEYSLLDGAARIADLVDRAVELEMPALAITDHGTMYGVIEFYQQCLERGIKPIIGCELYMAPVSRHENTGGQQSLPHLVLLATDHTGYRNLLKIITDAHLNGFYYKPRADFELLAQYPEGLIATTACLQGGVSQRLLNEDETSARQYLGQLQEIYGHDNVYLELQDHGIPEQRRVNEAIIRMAHDTQTPLVATNDIHYVRQEDARLHDVLLCIQTDSTLDEPNRMRFDTQEFYLKSQLEMEQLFGSTPEAISNSLQIAERCNLELELGNLNLPRLDVPDGYTPESYLQQLCDENVEGRYGQRPPEVLQRLEYELEVIARTGYTGYFLTVADFIREAKGRGILVGPGRGSATGSIVSYLLGITDVDPLKYHLIFERMLNPERVSPPDIDLDFPDDRREDIISYVREKYGADHVAQVITFSRMGPRASIRDVGRVMQMPMETVSAVLRQMPEGPKGTIAGALTASSELTQMVEADPEIKQFIEFARGVEGLARHVSVHAAAVVISDRPLTDVVPLCKASRGEAITTQYSMDDVTACGLVKMDFLGLKTLTVIGNALEAIAENHGHQIALHDIGLDDPAAYELLCRAGTAAVFQLESEGMQSLLKQLQPARFEHIIALVALYRPGPMRHAPEFCAGRHGEAIRYLHPSLEPILEETYGVILYQEQVMKIASDVAGFSMPQAEIIMRAMAKKMHDRMAQMKPQFIEGCVANGLSEETAEAIYERMETFSDYGFNKSHSAAYALVAYWTAYLKANYPAEFMAAHLSTVMDSVDDVAKYVMECRRMGLTVRPPSVNFSQSAFSVTDGAVVFGLAAIRNFGKSSAEAIVRERKDGGPYRGLYDFCRRLPAREVSKAALKLLIQAGAFDEFGDRNALLAAHEVAAAAGQKRQEDQDIGQSSLFDSAETAVEEIQEQLPNVPSISDEDKLATEKEILGMYITDHPLIRAQERMDGCCTCPIEELSQFPDNETVIVGGMVGETKLHTTSNGSAMMFMTLEGMEQDLEVTLFPKVYDTYKELAIKGDIILVEGQVQRRGRTAAEGDEIVDIKLLGKRLRPLQGARPLSDKRRSEADAARQRQKEIVDTQLQKPTMPQVHIEMDITMATSEALQQLQQVICAYPGSQSVILEFRQNGVCRRVNLGTKYQVNCDTKLVAQARQVCGVIAVWM